MYGTTRRGTTAKQATCPTSVLWIVLDDLPVGNGIQNLIERESVFHHFLVCMVAHPEVSRTYLVPQAIGNVVVIGFHKIVPVIAFLFCSARKVPVQADRDGQIDTHVP